MSSRVVPAASADLTGNGTSDGYVTVADASPFHAGARAALKNAASPEGTEVEIESVDSGTDKLGLRIAPAFPPRGINYGRSSMAAYTVAGGWAIFMPSQVVPEVG